ncbi:protein kinase, partial [Helicosporidium sp. ATCC 50920]
MSAGASRSISNIMASHQVRREYPTSADAYELLEEAGRGVSATVWSAICKPFNEPVAIKLMDLENMNCSLDEIVREAQTMRSLNHPCLLPLLASFVHRENLWMVMPYVSGGSVLNIMRFAYPDGLDEPVIATIMRDVLRGLEYLHRRGIIHRDVKAGNILLDAGGHVLLADFGVATTLERGGSWGNLVLARNTFVGTPCWMAPEVMEQTQGYDERADIWSFGITLLEMAHGHAPFARLPPMKVLLMTLQNPPPTLDSEPTKKPYSKAMRELVAKCLVKDPARRPSASSLLEHKFFKTAHDSSYLQRHLLAGLPSVPERVQLMKAGHGTRPDV